MDRDGLAGGRRAGGNYVVDTFVSLPPEERRRLLEEAEARLNLPRTSIEKDFWVCWILRDLFGLPEWGASLTFQGGTALSKAWNLIERFSEDIDIVVRREFLGFGGAHSPENAPSRKKQRRWLGELKATCQERIRDSLQPALVRRLKEALPHDASWTIERDPDDQDVQTLLFNYPAVCGQDIEYVRPAVRIELGARSDTEPAESRVVRPYLADAFPDHLPSAAVAVTCVTPPRTFREKAMLLHGETFRPEGRTRKARLARHYYDVWCLIRRGIASEAAADLPLFHRIVAHREVFFRRSWVDYATIRPGSLRLVPREDQLADWRSDYEAMRDVMFFGEGPRFDDAIEVVSDFQTRFNDTAAAHDPK